VRRGPLRAIRISVYHDGHRLTDGGGGVTFLATEAQLVRSALAVGGGEG
jgi:hypothetical protein